MSLTYTSAIAALLNNGNGKQVLPISMANLIELSKDKGNFGTSAQSVQDALSYLAGSFEHANTAAKTAQDNAYAYVGQEIGKLDVNAVGSSDKNAHNKYISYIWEQDGKIEAFAQDMSAANVAYSGSDSRATVAAELEHINATIAKNLTDTALKLVNAAGGEVANNTVIADGTEYQLKQGENVVAKFNIEKDSFVKSGSVVRRTHDADGNFRELEPNETGVPGNGKGQYQYYIKLEIRTNDEGGNAERTLYIPAESLVDAYTAKNDGNNVTITVDQNSNTISAKINAGGVGTTELAASAVTTAKIANDAVETTKIKDGNVTKAKLANDVQASLGKADSALQQADITTGSTAGTISVKGTNVSVNGLANVATTGKASDVSIETINELNAIAGESKTVNNVQDALATLAGKVKAINDGAVTSVKTNVVDNGNDAQNAVNISMTPTSGEKGDVTVTLTHNLGAAAALGYDATASATPISLEFWTSLNK